MANIEELIERGNQAFNRHDVDGLIGLYADNAELKGPGGMVARGKDEIRRYTEGWIQGFPDCKISVTNRAGDAQSAGTFTVLP